MSKIRVPPNPNYIAEVVVLLTSLGAKRSELNAGRHACNILEIKRVHRKVIDFNMDARAGHDSGEEAAIERMETTNVVKRNEDGDLLLPQIFVDGYYVGDASVLQGLEDDGLLGRILRRQLCLKCHQKKKPEEMKCPACGAVFEEVMPKNMSVMDELTRYYGTYEDEDREEEESDSGSESGERLAEYEAAIEVKQKKAVKAAPKRPAPRPSTKPVAPRKGSLDASPKPAAPMPPLAEEKPAAAAEAAAPEPAPAKVELEVPPPEPKKPDKPKKQEPPKEEKLPEMEGYLWKKSPNALRLRSFEKRYFLIKDMQIYWWKDKKDAVADPVKGIFTCVPKGFINLTVGAVEFSPMLGNETTFSLKPKSGNWEPGSIMKGDTVRSFTFDTTDSDFNRDQWATVLRKHIKKANEITPKGADEELVPGESFYAAVGLSAPSKSR